MSVRQTVGAVRDPPARCSVPPGRLAHAIRAGHTMQISGDATATSHKAEAMSDFEKLIKEQSEEIMSTTSLPELCLTATRLSYLSLEKGIDETWWHVLIQAAAQAAAFINEDERVSPKKEDRTRDHHSSKEHAELIEEHAELIEEHAELIEKHIIKLHQQWRQGFRDEDYLSNLNVKLDYYATTLEEQKKDVLWKNMVRLVQLAFQLHLDEVLGHDTQTTARNTKTAEMLNGFINIFKGEEDYKHLFELIKPLRILVQELVRFKTSGDATHAAPRTLTQSEEIRRTTSLPDLYFTATRLAKALKKGSYTGWKHFLEGLAVQAVAMIRSSYTWDDNTSLEGIEDTEFVRIHAMPILKHAASLQRKWHSGNWDGYDANTVTKHNETEMITQSNTLFEFKENLKEYLRTESGKTSPEYRAWRTMVRYYALLAEQKVTKAKEPFDGQEKLLDFIIPELLVKQKENVNLIEAGTRKKLSKPIQLLELLVYAPYLEPPTQLDDSGKVLS